jgi:hypothetical protein
MLEPPEDVGGCRRPVCRVVPPVDVIAGPTWVHHLQRHRPASRPFDVECGDTCTRQRHVGKERELGLPLGMDEPPEVEETAVHAHVRPERAEVGLVDPEGSAHDF